MITAESMLSKRPVLRFTVALFFLQNILAIEPAAKQSIKGGQACIRGPKFEIKHKSFYLQKSKLVDLAAKHVDWGRQASWNQESGNLFS